MMIEFKVKGQPPSKSNCHMAIIIKGVVRIVNTNALKKYERDFIAQTPGNYRNIMLSEPLKVTLDCFYVSKRPDLDNSAKIILDSLQRAGVIKNDNLVYDLHMTKSIDKENPRVEIKIEEY